MFYKNGVIKNFAKFTRKHLCQSLVFNNVAALRSKVCNFLKKEALSQVFCCSEISWNTFLIEHLGWLLLPRDYKSDPGLWKSQICSELAVKTNDALSGVHWEPCQTYRVSVFANTLNGLKPLTISTVKLHRWCLRGFWIHCWFSSLCKSGDVVNV